MRACLRVVGWDCGRAAGRAGGQTGGLPAGRARRRAAGCAGRAGGPCASRRQRVRVSFQPKEHPARNLRASLPRVERAPSGEVASGRLIIALNHRQSIIHRRHRIDRSSALDHRTTITFKARSSSLIDDCSSSSSDRSSTIHHQ